MTEPVITEAELFRELDALRKPEHPGFLLTDEQFKLIQYARGGKRRVTWEKLAIWWEEKAWGKIKGGTLHKRYTKDIKRRGLK